MIGRGAYFRRGNVVVIPPRALSKRELCFIFVGYLHVVFHSLLVCVNAANVAMYAGVVISVAFRVSCNSVSIQCVLITRRNCRVLEP